MRVVSRRNYHALSRVYERCLESDLMRWRWLEESTHSAWRFRLDSTFISFCILQWFFGTRYPTLVCSVMINDFVCVPSYS